MITDFISDMLTRIRNASLVKHKIVIIPYNNININILKILVQEKYIERYKIKMASNNFKFPTIKINLKYNGWWLKKSFFSILKRISKSSKRIFCSYKDFQKFIESLKYQDGIAIISTSSGILSHIKAQKIKKGGEILCFIG